MKHILPIAAILLFSFACGSKSSDAPADAAGSIEQLDGASDEGTSNANSQPETPSDDPCDQFLTEYEDWTNRYLEILRQYKQNPSDMSMIQKFTEMANETTQWTERAPQCTEQRHLVRLEAISQRLTEAANLMAQ